MSTVKSAKRAPPGRPPTGDDEQILAYMTGGIAQGWSISALARHGLSIGGYREDVDGRLRFSELRYIGPAALERRYRRLLKKMDDGLTERGVIDPPSLPRVAFARSPARPLAFPQGKTLPRGRPRKMRKR